MSLGQLYGADDPVSKEWTDGVLAVAFRTATRDTSPVRKCAGTLLGRLRFGGTCYGGTMVREAPILPPLRAHCSCCYCC